VCVPRERVLRAVLLLAGWRRRRHHTAFAESRLERAPTHAQTTGRPPCLPRPTRAAASCCRPPRPQPRGPPWRSRCPSSHASRSWCARACACPCVCVCVCVCVCRGAAACCVRLRAQALCCLCSPAAALHAYARPRLPTAPSPPPQQKHTPTQLRRASHRQVVFRLAQAPRGTTDSAAAAAAASGGCGNELCRRLLAAGARASVFVCVCVCAFVCLCVVLCCLRHAALQRACSCCPGCDTPSPHARHTY
jgi:hypothetical protein